MVEKFRKLLSYLSGATVWRALLFRGALLGLGLWLVLTDDRYVNLCLNFVALVIAMIWSYGAGLLSNDRRSGQWLEGVVLYLIAVAASNALSLFLQM